MKTPLFARRFAALSLAATFCLAGTTAFGARPAVSQAQTAKSGKISAAIFHADWCGACKKMGPDVMKIMDSLKGHPHLQFVMFDLTDEKTKAASQKTARQKGLAQVYANNQKTGVVLLVSPMGKVVGQLSSADTQSAMRAKISQAVQSVKG